MIREMLKDPISHEVLPTIFEGDEPKAVIITVERYKALIALLENMSQASKKETQILAESATFKNLVDRGLQEIEQGEVENWREAFNEM